MIRGHVIGRYWATKRIEHILSSDPAKLRIMSVNPDYETYERDAEEVNVIGRVVWSARRH